VRARHNDIQRIERTLLELNQLFRDLTEQIDIQHPLVQQAEEQTEHVKADTEAANVQLNKGVDHARRARKIKWIICIIITIIVLGVALGVGIFFGTRSNNTNNTNKPGPTTTVTQAPAVTQGATVATQVATLLATATQAAGG
jgi:syntaxin 1B/2/3